MRHRSALEVDDAHVKSMCHLATLLEDTCSGTRSQMQPVRDEARELISQALEADADADEDDKYEWLAKHSARFLGE